MQRFDSDLVRNPQIIEALNVFSAFQSGDTTAFFHFYRSCDFLSAVAVSSKVEFMRYKQLVSVIKACHPALGDQIPLRKLRECLCLTDEAHARKYLDFCGLAVKKSVKKELGYVVHIPKRQSVVEKGFFLESDSRTVCHRSIAEVMEALRPFHESHGIVDPMLDQKFAILESGGFDRTDIIFGAADPGCTASPTTRSASGRSSGGGSSAAGGSGGKCVLTANPNNSFSKGVILKRRAESPDKKRQQSNSPDLDL